MNFSFEKIFKKVQWDPNVYFLCAHTVEPEIKEMMKNGDLSIDIDDEKHLTKDEHINMIIFNQKIVLGEEAHITSLWLYKTPLYDKQWTSYFLHHQYIILELLVNNNQTKYCCLDKNRKRISIIYSDTLEFVRDHWMLRPGEVTKRFQSEYWIPQESKKMFLYSDFYELVRFLFLSEENEKVYDCFYKNCHHFCTNVINFLEKHEIK